MYKHTNNNQTSFLNFNQPIGLHMNPKNRWIILADLIPWNVFEEKYAGLFPSSTGNVAKPLRMALGSLIIQKRYSFSDEELVAQIQENAYYQYFIGLSGYQEEAPFESSSLVHFRKRLSFEIITEANEYLINPPQKDNEQDKNDLTPSIDSLPDTSADTSVDASADTLSEQTETDKVTNKGTMMIDATCAPSYVKYPQDFALLNDAREKSEEFLDRFCSDYGLKKPRMYRFEARKNYLNLAKSKKRSTKKIRKTIRKQLAYVKRDLGYLEDFMTQGFALKASEIMLLLTIYILYDQQEYMYKNKTHQMANRIISISQPYIRPIVRGKVKSPVEFGAKLDISIVDGGFARIEKISFDPYNESICLKDAIKRYYERNGYYPERVLADKIYRTRENISYCKEKGIRLSGPKLGRPSLDAATDKKTEYKDNVDRIEVERAFSLAKRIYGLGSIRTKLLETSLTSIALSIFTMNLFRASSRLFLAFFTIISISYKLLLKVLKTNQNEPKYSYYFQNI